MVSHNKKDKSHEGNEPVLDFISGKTNTVPSRRLTKNIQSIRSLWLLAKMKKDVAQQENFK